MDDVIVYLAACIVTAMAMLSVLRWRYPTWSMRRVSLLSALPIPLITLAVCAWIIGKMVMTPRAQCGVDACGMGIAYAAVVAVIALAGFVLAWGIGAGIVLLRERRGGERPNREQD